jgi:hypothetical protein
MAASLLALSPALPLHTAGKYVAGAYIVLFALILIYVTIMAIRLSHIQRELGELLEISQRNAAEPSLEHEPAEHDARMAIPVEGHQ